VSPVENDLITDLLRPRDPSILATFPSHPDYPPRNPCPG
jgi:hypothetical protein